MYGPPCIFEKMRVVGMFGLTTSNIHISPPYIYIYYGRRSTVQYTDYMYSTVHSDGGKGRQGAIMEGIGARYCIVNTRIRQGLSTHIIKPPSRPFASGILSIYAARPDTEYGVRSTRHPLSSAHCAPEACTEYMPYSHAPSLSWNVVVMYSVLCAVCCSTYRSDNSTRSP